VKFPLLYIILLYMCRLQALQPFSNFSMLDVDALVLVVVEYNII
jgi:hypothetical protein